MSIAEEAGDNPHNNNKGDVIKIWVSFTDYQCIVSYNIAIIIQKHQEVYDNTIEINQL